MTINMEENTENREVWIKNHMEKRKENKKQSQKSKNNRQWRWDECGKSLFRYQLMGKDWSYIGESTVQKYWLKKGNSRGNQKHL